MMLASFSPPLSGEVLDVLVDVFDLRAFDRKAGLRDTNARRYLRGERVSPEAETHVQVAVAEALLAADLVPQSTRAADLFPELPAGAPELPPATIVALVLKQYALHWDALAGALRRLTAPVAFPNHAAGACLRLVAIDVAVRITAALWLARTRDEHPLSDFWTKPYGVGHWLRDLQKRAGLTRDELADRAGVAPNTLDDWLDIDVRPDDDNLTQLARSFAESGLGDETQILRHLRLAFASRDIFRAIESIVETPQALGICQRVVLYTNAMLRFPRMSAKARQENDLKMRFALVFGTLGRDCLSMKWVASMLNHLWRCEDDPVWRTSLRAVTSSWLEHLQDITAKLGPVDRAKLTEVLGQEPTGEYLEAMAYRVQASKEEWTREPGVAEAMLTEIIEGGEFATLELKDQAGEASANGDLLAAIDLLRAAVTEDPMNAEVHFRLGCNLWQVGDVSGVITELEIAAQLDPSWDRPRVEIAIVLLNERRDGEALAKLVMAASELPSTSAWVLLHLAYAHERLGHLQEAIDAYENLLGVDADHAEALDRVAHLHFLSGNKRDGVARAKDAAHLGIPTVLRAWKQGYYDDGPPENRPPHAGLENLLQFPDSAWRTHHDRQPTR